MVDLTIRIPEYLIVGNFDQFFHQEQAILQQLKELPKEANITLDFSETRYVSQLGFLVIARFADIVSNYKGSCVAQYAHKDSLIKTILRVMGLTKREPGTPEVQKYWDMIRVDVKRCHNAEESLSAVNRVMKIIQSKNLPAPLLKAINWALFEAIDNAGVHGYKTYDDLNATYSAPVYFCAYSFPEETEIAILDLGQGIQSSFLNSGNAKYANISNEEALKFAIMLSESGNPKGSPGFGLYGCSEIARRFDGEFRLLSGSNLLRVTSAGQEIIPYLHYAGTMVSLKLNNLAVIQLEELFGESSIIALEDIDSLIGDFE